MTKMTRRAFVGTVGAVAGVLVGPSIQGQWKVPEEPFSLWTYGRVVLLGPAVLRARQGDWTGLTDELDRLQASWPIRTRDLIRGSHARYHERPVQTQPACIGAFPCVWSNFASQGGLDLMQRTPRTSPSLGVQPIEAAVQGRDGVVWYRVVQEDGQGCDAYEAYLAITFRYPPHTWDATENQVQAWIAAQEDVLRDALLKGK